MGLTSAENDAIRRLIEALPDPRRSSLLHDLDFASVANVAADRSMIEFSIQGYVRPPYEGQTLLPVEGVLKDADGATIHVLVFVDTNGRLLELELIRWADGPVIEPNWSSMALR